jgi:hypothetical protein
MMRQFIILIIFLTAGSLAKAGTTPQKFDKAAFYAAMAATDADAIESQLAIVKDAPAKEREGYEGALLMKKASLVKKPKQKLSFFKAGRIKLETAIMADADNTEFGFLRLAIEEHAPKIVRYHADIQNDKLLVIKNFKSVSPAVQHAILDYTKNSKVLHKEDL